jgi:hypothetical protein
MSDNPTDDYWKNEDKRMLLMLEKCPEIKDIKKLMDITIWHCPANITKPLPTLKSSATDNSGQNLLIGFLGLMVLIIFVLTVSTLFSAHDFSFSFFIILFFFLFIFLVIKISTTKYKKPVLYGNIYILTVNNLYIFELIDSHSVASSRKIILVDKITSAQHKETESLIYTNSLTPIMVPHHDGKSLAKVLLELRPDDIIDPNKN